MQDRHRNKVKYYKEQGITTSKYVIPLLEKHIKVDENTSVLEIGCGEAGNLTPFLDLGCKRIMGIDLSPSKISNATNYLSDHPNKDSLELVCSDIYDIDGLAPFDVVIMRDTLEHIHDQERFMGYVTKFLKPDSMFFLGFPPWHNPFGGHQQICESKFLSKLPYFHILPRSIYAGILKLFGESQRKVDDLIEIKDTAITIERFERILKKFGYKKESRDFYLVNPNYEIKFGMKPRIMPKVISSIPYLRNFFITTNYYVISFPKAS